MIDALEAQSRRRHAQVFFLVTGDHRRAHETQDYDDEAWTAALHARVRARKRVAPVVPRSIAR
ncbi:MAG: hypothetical protein ABIV92_07735, partial [Thermoflexales bacterium]